MAKPPKAPASQADAQARLRQHVLDLLQGGGAHLDFDAAVANLPTHLRGGKPESLPHTPWRLVEHMRLAQRDILDYCRSADYDSPPWPEGYWPDTDGPPDGRAWQHSLKAFRADAETLQQLVADPATDLLAPLPWGGEHTILREALLVADHNSYHLGQLVTVRRLLGAWEE